MSLHHPTLLVASILVTSILAAGQLMFGYFYKGSKAARDIAIGTLLYTLLCIYYLNEPYLPSVFRLISVLLIAFKIFFIYRALRQDFLYKSNDRFDSIFLIIALPVGIATILSLGFREQQLIYTSFILFFFVKAGILIFRRRKSVHPALFATIAMFIVTYPGVFVIRSIKFFFVPPTADSYSLETSSIVTTAVLMVLYTASNIGVHIIAIIREQEKIQSHLNDALKEKEFANGLVKIIGHDLRGYIGGISRAGEALINRSDPVLPVIEGNARKAQSLLTELVYWGRSRTGFGSNNEDFVSVSTLIEAAVSDVKGAAEVRNIGIETAPGSELVRADSNAARVVLRNLLANALKFSKTGSTIKISARQVDKDIVVRVSDEGVGMCEALLDKIRNGDSVPSEASTGTGLKIVTSVSEAYGWKLRFDSETGKGTTVSLFLPRIEQA
jgi:signal transduction histidine kinase